MFTDRGTLSSQRHHDSIAECTVCLWHVIGCAEAYFTADTDAEREMAEAEFWRHVRAARAIAELERAE